MKLKKKHISNELQDVSGKKSTIRQSIASWKEGATSVKAKHTFDVVTFLLRLSSH